MGLNGVALKISEREMEMKFIVNFIQTGVKRLPAIMRKNA